MGSVPERVRAHVHVCRITLTQAKLTHRAIFTPGAGSGPPAQGLHRAVNCVHPRRRRRGRSRSDRQGLYERSVKNRFETHIYTHTQPQRGFRKEMLVRTSGFTY